MQHLLLAAGLPFYVFFDLMRFLLGLLEEQLMQISFRQCRRNDAISLGVAFSLAFCGLFFVMDYSPALNSRRFSTALGKRRLPEKKLRSGEDQELRVCDMLSPI